MCALSWQAVLTVAVLALVAGFFWAAGSKIFARLVG